MARAKRSKRQRGAAKGLPGWAMLTIGLIIGLFVAFLVYLDDLDQTSDATARAPALEESELPADVTDEDAADEDGPRFEFYSILPELEVVVPDFGQGGDGADDETAPAPDEDTQPADGAIDEADRRYFLQAGSFREAEPADRLKAEIALLGLDVAVQDVQVNGERWHRVRVGPFSQRDALQSAQQRLRAHEIDYLMMREKASG
ncbi:MAG: SPOR domain-containing protein [Halofilum sp. (in: g-proteobacteria)]